MLLAIVCTLLRLAVLVLGKSRCCFLVLGDSETLELKTHCLKSLTETLDDVKAVYDDGRLWETLLCNAVHGIAEVHRDFLYLGQDLGWYLLDYLRYNISLGALDNSDDRAFTTMSVLVRQYGLHLLTQLRLIYAATLADVLCQQYPVNGMILLVPLLVITEVMLIVAFYFAALNMKESC